MISDKDLIYNCSIDDLSPLKEGGCSSFLTFDEIRQGDLQAIGKKMTAFLAYFIYFSNVAMSTFKYTGFEKTQIPIDYVERALFYTGRLAFFDGSKMGLPKDIVNCSTFNWGSEFNHYGQETKIQLFNNLPYCSDELNHVEIQKEDFEILNYNKTKTPIILYIYYFCSKIMKIQTAIEQNTLNNSMPIAVECTKEQILALNNIISNISNQNRFLFFKKMNNARPEDLFKTLDLNVEFKSDKMIEVVNYYKSEFLNFLGVNNTPYEKKERLITDEAKANNQILNLTISSAIDEQKRCFEKINKRFNTNFNVELNFIVDEIVDKKTTENAENSTDETTEESEKE